MHQEEDFMPTYKIAHITGQGVNVVIFSVKGSFGVQTNEEQSSMIKIFQAKSKAAGFNGNVAVVWDGPDGKINFRAPLNQHAFFNKVTSEFIEANLNKSISW